MNITVNWGTKVISVPRAQLRLLQSSPTEIRELDSDDFRLALKALEADEGVACPDTHRHNTGVSVGGVTLARVIELINGYTVTFEDGQYAVNIVGSNNNISDRTNVNQVSVRSSNSSGLIAVNTGGGAQTGPNAAEIAAAVRANLLLELARLDVAVSTRSTIADIAAFAP
jgi:hypothetical protein